MRDIDKNDVDISKLFLWKKKVEIKDELSQDVATVYLRLIGDADIGKARAYSFRRSAELRRKLKTVGTDEYEAFMNTDVDFQDKDALVSAVLYLNVNELAEQARKSVNLPEPKEPKSDATIEQLEQYQTDIDEYPDNYGKALQKEIDKVIKQETKRLEKLDEAELSIRYKERIINRLCTEEVNKAFYEMVVYLSTYKDNKYKVRSFLNMDEFLNSSSLLKKRLLEEYQSLELGMDFLKKSLEVTQ